MDRDALRALLGRVADGTTDPAEALDALAAPPVTHGVLPVEGMPLRLDTHRPLRTGEAEAVLADGKTVAQTLAAVRALRGAHLPALVTRADEETRAALLAAWPAADVDEAARLVLVGDPPPARGLVVVVSAGTSDAAVAAEAAGSARACGAGVQRVDDVGVAGLHRILAVRPTLAAADAVVVAAGMDGALPSVVAGLVSAPVVAVPTSVGYGASFGGVAALLTMLCSCAPGVTVVNIDNGFGAGLAAARVARAAARAATPAAR